MTARSPSSVPEIAADQANRLGIGPLWHRQERRLYWMDARSRGLFFYDPEAGKSGPVSVGEKIRQFLIGDDGSLLLFTDAGALKSMKDGVLSVLASDLPWRSGKLDAAAFGPGGRVYFAQPGALYRLEVETGRTEQLSGHHGRITGLAVDASGRLVACCDAVSHEVLLVSLQSTAAGSFPGPRVVARIPESLGIPHGVALDAKGFLWIAVWGGSCVLRVSLAGREERRVYFTAKLVSGLAFGGLDGKDLYVTTSGAEDRKANGPGAGALYRLRPGVKGIFPPET